MNPGLFLAPLVSKIHLLVKNSSFKKKLAEKLGLAAEVADETIIGSAKKWFKDSPMVAAGFMSTALSFTPTLVTEIFDGGDLSVVAQGMQDFSATNLVNAPERKEFYDQKMGNGESQDPESMTAAQAIVAYKRTKRIAEILTVPASQVNELVRLLFAVEPEDGENYERMSRL